MADANLRRLIEMTRDADIQNRDWATFLLAQEELDTPDVRHALICAAGDDSDIVRAEAVLGLTKIDPAFALPFLQKELAGDLGLIPLFEAAELCAHPSLIPDLEIWAEPSGEPFVDQAAARALAACKGGLT